MNDAAAAVGETNARTQPPCACLEGLRDDLSAGLRANVCVRNCGAWINPKREEAVLRQQDDRSWACGALGLDSGSLSAVPTTRRVWRTSCTPASVWAM